MKRLTICLAASLSAITSHATGANCKPTSIEFAGIYADGGTTKIVANSSCGKKLTIVQPYDKATPESVKERRLIRVNGKPLHPGGPEETGLLSALDSWVLSQLGKLSVAAFKDKALTRTSMTDAEMHTFVVIGLLEAVCNARKLTADHSLCQKYTHQPSFK